MGKQNALANEAKRPGRANARHLPAEFIRGLVDMANANNARMDGTIRPVLELIAENDVVFGVWPDASEPGGVGLLVVKGANRLRRGLPGAPLALTARRAQWRQS